MSSLLRAGGLRIALDGRVLADGLELTIQPGECWVVLGRNGSGKTRLLHTLAGLLMPSAGTLELGGERLHGLDARERARRLGLLLQHSDVGFHHTTLQLALSGSYARNGGWEDTQDLRTAGKALRQVQLESCASRLAQSLSGGELRRAEIARLLVQNPALAMLDEPLNHLDIGQQVAMLQLLKQQFTAAGHALLLVLHDLNLARRVASHLLLLYGDGRWCSGSVAQVGDATRLGEAFGYPLRELCAEGIPVLDLDLARTLL